MPECQLVHQSERRTTKDRNLAAGLQRTTSAQFVKLLAAGRVCTDSSGDEGMSKASTELLEQGTQTPSPAPDLIPAQTENQPRTHIGIGTANGGTSQLLPHKAKADVLFNESQQMSLWNLIFQAEVVEQRFGAVVLPHHDQQASDDQNQTEHGGCFLLTCFCSISSC